MTIEEFGQTIKQKYPQYSDIADAELGEKMLTKYPQYQDLVKQDVAGEKVGGFLEGQRVLKGINDLIGTTGLAKGITQGIFLKFTPEGKDLLNQVAEGKITQEDVEKIIGKTATTKEILGSAIQTGATAIAATVPVAGSILGKAAQFGGIGALSGAGGALERGEGIGGVARGAALSSLAGAGIGVGTGLGEKGFKAFGRFLGRTGEKIQTSIIKPTQADIRDGFSIQTVNKYKLGGSLQETFSKTDDLLDRLSRDLGTKIKASKSTLDLNETYEQTAKRVLGNKFESFGSNKSIDNALENLRSEIVSVSGKSGVIGIPEAQTIKRASGHLGAWFHGIPDPDATARQKVYNTFYNEIKTAIEQKSPLGVQEVNKQISELIPVMNALIRRIPVAERNATMSLGDIITLTGATLEPRALGVSLLNLASKSGKVGAFLTEKGAKFGESAARGAVGTGRFLGSIPGKF